MKSVQKKCGRVTSARLPKRWLAVGACLIFVSTTVFLFAYTHEQDDANNAPVATKWCNGNLNNGLPCTNTVNWSMGPTGTNVDTVGGPTIIQAIQNAFASWQDASLNGQSLASLIINQGPPSSKTAPDSQDCVNVVGFTDTNSSDFPTGTIAFTDIATVFGSPPLNYQCADSSNPSATYTCPLPSCIVDADIEFNPKDTFSTAPTTPQNDFDLQAIATHEVGHLLGLDHSGLANAIMFAFGDTGGVPQRNLSVDDAIGIGSVYPSQKFAGVTGTLSGRVTLGGSGLFASHVVVMDATSGTAVTDTLTNMDGSYQIAVPQGQYHVIAIPLQGIYDLSDFGGWACGYNENAQPCCDPSTSTSCTGNLSNSVNTNFSGKFN